ncbi:hypothetical protein [Haloarcula sediminis]|uniref:hypothetical protein n=1 Tax=Haloarcula sediminis TaxID=3111777 RepID=UPI002D77D4EC|nr:hypothetical protein [Haloarcula sp. CK38]
MNGLGSLTELLSLVLSAVAAGLLTVVGALTENAGVADMLVEPSVFAVWEVGMGLLLLYTGIYMLGYKRVWLGLRGQFAN